MTMRNRSMPPGGVIPELPYADLDVAVAWLCRSFGLRERLRIGGHRAQLLLAGDIGAIVAVQADPPFSTASLMVSVPDVDEHHRHAAANGVEIVGGAPVSHAYGERQYAARDLAGHHWVFSQSVADINPRDWGAQYPPARSPTSAPVTSQQVTLRTINAGNVRAVCRLEVSPDQRMFVAPNGLSLAQALFAPEAWYRAIYLDEEPVGFVMVEDRTQLMPPRTEIGVWRFMIDQHFQGRGIARTALLQVIEQVRSRSIFDRLQLSYVPGPGCPEPFYLGLGFRHTGRMDGIEVILELPLHPQIFK